MHSQPGQYVRRPAGRQYYPSQYPVHAFVPQQPVPSSSAALQLSQRPTESRARKQVGANFLPSIVNEAYHNVLEQVVTAMCYKMGFDDIEESALETMTLLFHSYIKRIGEQSRLACEVAGRTSVSPGDVWFGLVNMGIRVQELPSFLREQLNFDLTVHAPEITPVEQKTQALRIGTPRPHPNYVFEWLPPFPDPHTYIRTKIQEDPEFTYEKVRDAISQKKRNGVTSLVNYMVRNYPTMCLFRNFEEIIHEQVKNSFQKESEEKRMQEAFVAFRDLLNTNDIDEVKNVGKMLLDKKLIDEHDYQSGAEVVCMCSDGTLIDQQGQKVRLSDEVFVDLKESDKVSTSATRMSLCGEGAESLRYHWNMDEMLDELIELDSCTMDLSDNGQDELKYLQEKTTFEYLPEWCHILMPSFEHRAYLDVVSNDLKAEEESKKEKESVENGKVPATGEEAPKKEDGGVSTHENLYLCPPIRDDIFENDMEMGEEEELEEAPPTTSEASESGNVFSSTEN